MHWKGSKGLSGVEIGSLEASEGLSGVERLSEAATEGTGDVNSGQCASFDQKKSVHFFFIKKKKKRGQSVKNSLESAFWGSLGVFDRQKKWEKGLCRQEKAFFRQGRVRFTIKRLGPQLSTRM